MWVAAGCCWDAPVDPADGRPPRVAVDPADGRRRGFRVECRGRFLSCGISSGRSVVRDFERDFKWNAVRDFMWDCGMSRGISSWISCGISCGGRPRGWSTPRIWVVAGCCWDVAVDTLASCLPRAFACCPIGARLSQLVGFPGRVNYRAFSRCEWWSHWRFITGGVEP